MERTDNAENGEKQAASAEPRSDAGDEVGEPQPDEDRAGDDEVDEASKDSYPGSDAPAW